MTKAESWVWGSSVWDKLESRIEDHNSMANTTANIYVTKDGKFRLTCYSSHGDSILWEKNPHPDWRMSSEWHNPRNIEIDYDSVLPNLDYAS